MVGAALHDRVTGFEMNFRGIEHQRDLAFQDQAEVERSPREAARWCEAAEPYPDSCRFARARSP